jgi:hypothetical protein
LHGFYLSELKNKFFQGGILFQGRETFEGREIFNI